jgi:molybdopterin synthase catalytic subunit
VQEKYISSDPLNPAELFAHNIPSAGAIVLFSGEARNHHKGKEVIYLEYEAHESMASKAITDILNVAREKWNLQLARCVHRTGRLYPGESAVIVVTASSHREEAYEANRYIIDRVKSEAPIWKHEFYPDGSSEWGR